MSTASHADSGIRNLRIPTLAQMIREAQEFSKPKLKRLTREALLEWFNQSERLWIARTHYHLRGPRFIDFAERIGVDQSSAYQLVKLIPYKPASWRDARMKAATMAGKPVSTGTRDRRVLVAPSGSRWPARIWHATCHLPTVRHALHPRCLCDQREGSVCGLHPESARMG